MKHIYLIVFFLATQIVSRAQTAVDALNKISGEFTLINKAFVEYQSVIAHNNNANAAAQKRQKLLNQVSKSRQVIAEVPPYKGDTSLQKGISEYLKLVEYNMNEDYTKLVDMQKIAEQSYDMMEAYMLIKDQVSDKMQKASDDMSNVQKEYCKKYNITLSEDKSELSKQIEIINAVGHYQDKLQLVFMKCSFLNDDLVEAIGKKNINETEQLRSAMQKFAEEGLRTLDTMQAYNGDRSLINACRKSMQFFQQQAIRSADFTEFFTQEENFNRMKKQFEADKAMQNDKAAVKKYNDAVASMNKAVNTSNKTNEYLNNARKETYDNWNNAIKFFLDKHVPLV